MCGHAIAIRKPPYQALPQLSSPLFLVTQGKRATKLTGK